MPDFQAIERSHIQVVKSWILETRKNLNTKYEYQKWKQIKT